MPSCRGLAMEGWKGVSSLARYVKKGGSGLGYPPIVFIVIKQGVVDVGSC